MFNHISITNEGPTCIITLNRPKVLNALNVELLAELSAAVDSFVNNPELKGAILTGSGEKAFAAGADIAELSVLTAAEAEMFSSRGQAIFSAIEHAPKPIIAAVNGFALGGGCELSMACHFRIASDNARFGQPEVQLGLLPGYGGTQRLIKLIGRGKATELLITGDMIKAPEALQLGLVNAVVTQEELMDTCRGILNKSYAKSPLAIKLTLEAIADGADGKNGYATEAKNFGIAISSEDGKEGTMAFLEKRKAEFTGR